MSGRTTPRIRELAIRAQWMSATNRHRDAMSDNDAEQSWLALRRDLKDLAFPRREWRSWLERPHGDGAFDLVEDELLG